MSEDYAKSASTCFFVALVWNNIASIRSTQVYVMLSWWYWEVYWGLVCTQGMSTAAAGLTQAGCLLLQVHTSG